MNTMIRLRNWKPDPEVGMEAWANDTYQAFVTFEAFAGVEYTHLSIKRHDREPVHDWRDMQWIKNDVCGPEREAVELYPAESRMMDAANQYHLWVAPEGMSFPIGYFGGRQVMDDFPIKGVLGKQRPIPEARLQHGDRLSRQQRRDAARRIQAADAAARKRQGRS